MNKVQQASVELRAMDELAAQDSPCTGSARCPSSL